MGFERAWILWAFLIMPVLFFLFMRSWNKFSSFNFSLFHANSPSFRQRVSIGWIRLFAIALVILGIAEPYVFVASGKRLYKDVRLIFLVDVSRSMTMTEDVLPNRLEAAKKEISLFFDSLEGNYDTAIIPFAGAPNVYYCPLTNSRQVIDLHVKELNEVYAPALGTDLVKVFDEYKHFAEIEKINKGGINLVILLSDGGKHESSNVDRNKLLNLVRNLALKNNKVYTVGVGTTELVPLVIRDEKGDFVNYLTTTDGTIFRSELDEELLKKIAEVGNGEYVNFKSKRKLSSFLEQIIIENRRSAGKVVEYEKFYLHSYLFAFSVILIFIAFIYNRRWSWKAKTS